MIVDLKRFVEREQPYWRELSVSLDQLDHNKPTQLDLAAAQRLHYLYERAGAALARMGSFGADPQLREYLEALVGRAYGVVGAASPRRPRWRAVNWLIRELPRALRRRWAALALATAVMGAGMLLGALAIALDSQSKSVLLGDMSHLRIDPAQRVEQEEQGESKVEGSQASFASYLIRNNIQVSIVAMALGMTWGVGTIVVLFYNGVLLGAVVADYVLAGKGVFVAGWLLPHGSIEIPAILIAATAGLVLAGALLGRGSPLAMGDRLRAAWNDLVALIVLAALMLVWAGLVESFVSQYHQPQLPYALKIALGLLELGALAAWLTLGGSKERRDATP